MLSENLTFTRLFANFTGGILALRVRGSSCWPVTFAGVNPWRYAVALEMSCQASGESKGARSRSFATTSIVNKQVKRKTGIIVKRVRIRDCIFVNSSGACRKTSMCFASLKAGIRRDMPDVQVRRTSLFYE